MHKMYFNTGVLPENRLDESGKVVLMDFQVVKNGTIQIEFFLEEKPDDNLTFRYCAPSNYLDFKKDWEVAIKIVGGGMLSDYAIFTKK